MARKREQFNYFNEFINLSEYSVKSAVMLSEILESFNQSEIAKNVDEMHQIEHTADTAQHKIFNKLFKEFLPPIEREDIISLSQRIDDVTDAIEDVLICIDIYNVKLIKEEAKIFTNLIVDCCNLMNSLIIEFKHFKNSKKLHPLIVELNRLEGEGDKLYADFVRSLYVKPSDPIEVITWTNIFHRLERCCDACEVVANTIEVIVMKNS
ncbi:MAG TPA: DUF47 family protein [Clostridiales bacterium]|nr:DUF47 family protein [Clostridiales bacterium]